MTKKLYPCITYFEKDLENEIIDLQKDLYKLTGSQCSLQEWKPHITLGNAPTLDKNSLKKLSKELKSFAAKRKPVEAKLDGFDFMDDWKGSKLFNCEPYVIYLKVIVSSELLSLVKDLAPLLKEFDMDYNNIVFPYKPHLTLAFKDLDKKGFEKAKKYLKTQTFSKKIKIVSFSLSEGPKDLSGCFKEIARFKLKKIKDYYTREY